VQLLDTGLGVSKYKLGAFDEAVETLQRVVLQEPQQREARKSASSAGSV